jgi:hypothetical protein
VARKSAIGTAVVVSTKGNAGDKSVTVRPSHAAKGAIANPAKKSGHAKSDGRSKVKKDKLIRDGFAIPESEYGLIAAIKKHCLAKGMAVRKSEVLRAAIISFAARSDAAVTKALMWWKSSNRASARCALTGLSRRGGVCRDCANCNLRSNQEECYG